MTLKQHPAGGRVSEFLRLLLSAAAISLVLGSANALTCHCLYNEQCNSAGNCPYGCARGWYGPGCQLGNLALGKPAYQSTVYKQYTADQAVNGVMPPLGDVTESNCSHTAESNGSALWWYVQLSSSEDFVIKNVTIVNRQGIADALVANENVVNVTARGLYPCTATFFNIQCSQVPRDRLPTTFCNSLSCELNPYYNYTCSLQVTFSDGFKQAYSTAVNIDAADFSAIDIINTTTCDYVDAELRNVAPRWNPNPSFIVFFKQALVDNQTTVVRLPFGKSDSYSVRFAAVEDSEHFVWAAPETCWSKTVCANASDRACFDSAKCAIGRSTSAKFTKIQVRQYSLKLKDCCLSLDDQSPEICERPDYLKMTCLYGENATYEATGMVGNDVCSRPEGANYSCQIDAGLRNLTVKNTLFMITMTNDSLSQCLPRDLPSTSTQSFVAIIGGALGGGVLLIILIVLAVVLSLRKQKAKAKRNTKKIKTNKKHTTTNKKDNTGVKNEGYEKEDYCDGYVYPEDDSNATKYEESSSQIGVTINDDCEEYYVAYISEPPSSTNTKEAQSHHTTDTHKGIASYSNKNRMEREQPTTEVPEGYADYRLNPQHLSCSATRKLFKESSGPPVPPSIENDETEESEYVNIHQLQRQLGLTQPIGSVLYTNSDTGCESPGAHPSEGISYVNSKSPRKKKRKPKAKTSGK